MKLIGLIWTGLIFDIFILMLIKPLVTDFESIGILAVSFHVLYTILIILSVKSDFKLIFIGAFFTRLPLMVWELYGRNIFILPNSGGDAYGFMNSAIAISESISLINGSIYGGLYSKIIGILFYLVGPQPMLGHYINVLLSLSVIIIIYSILVLLEVKPKIVKIALLIAAFFPNSVLLSVIFLREMFITFFVTFSLYYFIKWFKVGKNKDMILSIIMLGIASMFHSGVVGVFVGYTFAFLFYNKEKKYRFTIRTVFSFLFISTVLLLVFTQYESVFLAKFDSVEGLDDIYSTANRRLGESAYLTGITITNPVDFIIYGPIKAFYFLTAPLPMDWRDFMDIFTFMSDSLLYLVTIIYYVINRKRLNNREPLVMVLWIILISVSVIFGIGVGNAGTAVRHRQKIISVVLIFIAVIINSKITNSNKTPNSKIEKIQ